MFQLFVFLLWFVSLFFFYHFSLFLGFALVYIMEEYLFKKNKYLAKYFSILLMHVAIGTLFLLPLEPILLNCFF